jgi:hypothetical protein
MAVTPIAETMEMGSLCSHWSLLKYTYVPVLALSRSSITPAGRFDRIARMLTIAHP